MAYSRWPGWYIFWHADYVEDPRLECWFAGGDLNYILLSEISSVRGGADLAWERSGRSDDKNKYDDDVLVDCIENWLQDIVNDDKCSQSVVEKARSLANDE